jgi:flagellar basal-body rod protein FlgB
MSFLNQKQSMLAENVANANTPGYKAREMAPMSFGDVMQQTQVSMVTTDSRHIVPAAMAGANARTNKSKSYDVVPTGNSVNIEEQMMEVSKTSIEYQEVTSLLHKFTGLFKIAIKGSST